MGDDADIFRNTNGRLIDMREGMSRAEARSVPPPGDLMAVQVFNGGSMPASVPGVFATHPVALGGPEAAGSAGTAAADTTRAEVTVLGPKVPAAGDVLLARRVGGRWVADRTGAAYGGGIGKIGVPGCPCLMPTTITMSVVHPEANFGMFQPCTIAYGPVPTELEPLSLGPFAYISTTTLSDQVTLDRFWYRFFCSGGFFCLSRVYAKSVFGSPFSEAIRYRWLAGQPGNTCNPLLLTNGRIFPGGDPTSVVSLSE